MATQSSQPRETANGPRQPATPHQAGSTPRSELATSGQGAPQYPAVRDAYARGSNPFSSMMRFMSEIDRMFDDFTRGSSSPMTAQTRSMATWNPAIEAFERDGALIVRADLPGVPSENVHVEVDGDLLTVSGERKQENKEEREGYYHSERSYGSFQRTIALPQGVDPSTVQASFDHGVLEVTVPMPERKSARKVEIGKKTGPTTPGAVNPGQKPH